MGENERDETGDWVLPAQARPATIAQLEQRIDHALAVAKASEAAALEIGAAAIDAAEQARRAAELAEQASERANGAGPAAAVAAEPEPVGGDEAADAPQGPTISESEAAYDSFKSFLERADRVSARLEAIAPR
jgi:hypothetical protein